MEENEKVFKIVDENSLIEILKCFSSKSEFDDFVSALSEFSLQVIKMNAMIGMMKCDKKQKAMLDASIVLIFGDIMSYFQEIVKQIMSAIKLKIVKTGDVDKSLEECRVEMNRVFDGVSDFDEFLRNLEIKDMDL